MALELVRVEGEDVSTVVLVEVGEVVVEENRGFHFLGGGELDMASRVVHFDAVVKDGADVLLPRPLSIHGTVRTLECGADSVAGNGLEAFAIFENRGINNAIGVVESNLLNLGLRIRVGVCDIATRGKGAVPERSRTVAGPRWERI